MNAPRDMTGHRAEEPARGVAENALNRCMGRDDFVGSGTAFHAAEARRGDRIAEVVGDAFAGDANGALCRTLREVTRFRLRDSRRLDGDLGERDRNRRAVE